MCGGKIIPSADQTTGTCECCGSTVVLSKLNQQQRINAMNRGNEFRACGDFDTALSIYEHIIAEDDTDAEAHWCCALCRFGIEYVQDPTTLEYLPTCHRLSLDSFLEDVDYLAAMANSSGMAHWQYQREGAKIAAVQRSTLSTSRTEKPFDIFLSCKDKDDSGARTEDSVLAQEIYYYLTKHGFRVFFSRITLEKKAGEEFEPYIFSALNSAKVMVLIGTKPEYLNSPWVKNEWSRFLNLKKRHPDKLLLPCYKDMDPQTMPAPLNSLQSYNMGQIAFLQDLLHGVKKLFSAQKPAFSAQGIPVNMSGAAVVSTENLLTRARFFLEDQDWENADRYCERALDTAPRCADAYFYKLVAAWHLNTPHLPALARRLEIFSPDLTQIEAESISRENVLFFWNLYQKADSVNRLNAILELYPALATHQLSTAEWQDTSLLNHAIRNGTPRAVEVLLKHKADPNAAYRKWNFGEEPHTCSPLSEAVQAENGAQMVQVLLNHGADPALTDMVPTENHALAPQNVFQQAVTFRKPAVLTALLEWQENQYAQQDMLPPKPPLCFLLRQAVTLGFPDMVEVLLNHRADPDEAFRCEAEVSYSLLGDAMRAEDAPVMVALLLNHGADPNICDTIPTKFGVESVPALHQAILLQKSEIISLLLEHGASWETRYSDGRKAVPLRLYPYYMVKEFSSEYLSELEKLGWKHSMRSAFTLSTLLKDRLHQLVDKINE